MADLDRLNVPYETHPPRRLKPGTVSFIGTDASHDTFVTSAWVDDPLAWLLARVQP